SVVRRGSDKTAGAGRNHEERADRGEGHREAEDERDGDALRMQDLAALVREFVVDPLPPFVHPLHEAGGLEFLEVLEEGRLAQAQEIAQVRDGLPPRVEALQDPDSDVRGERLEALLVQRDLRAAGVHGLESDGALGVHMHRVDVELPGDEEGDVIQANIAIFDQMGEHAIRENFRDALFYGTQGALAVCDIERPETLRTLSDWIRAISAVTG